MRDPAIVYVTRVMCAQTSRRPPSAASLFRSSLAALVAGLHSKEPFYVRCLKPNPLQAPSTWDPLLVTHPSLARP